MWHIRQFEPGIVARRRPALRAAAAPEHNCLAEDLRRALTKASHSHLTLAAGSLASQLRVSGGASPGCRRAKAEMMASRGGYTAQAAQRSSKVRAGSSQPAPPPPPPRRRRRLDPPLPVPAWPTQDAPLPSPDRLLTDRGSYIGYLESQLERVSAACLTVQVRCLARPRPSPPPPPPPLRSRMAGPLT